MGVSRVDFGDRTIFDISGDTVTPAALDEGVTAHDASGEQIVGMRTPDIYWATYDDSTFEDVRAAYVADKVVLCAHGNWVEALQICTATVARFVALRADNGYFKQSDLTADGWTSGVYRFVPTARTINGRALSDDIELGATYTVTLAADGWTESGDWLVQTVSVPGLLAQYNAAPLVDVALSGQDAEADAEIAAAWAQISGQMVAETDADVLAIQLPASVGAPEVNIPVRITVYD